MTSKFMIRKILFLLLLSLFSFSGFAQRFKYGVKLAATTAFFANSNASHSSDVSLGLGFYFNPRLNPYSYLETSLSLNNYRFYSDDLKANLRFNNIDAIVGYERHFKALPQSLSVVPFYSFTISHFGQNNLSFQAPVKRINHGFKLYHGIGAGIKLRVSSYTTLSASYSVYPFQNLHDQGTLNAAKLGVYFNFADFKRGISQKEIVAMALDSLSRDTLYVVNRACSDLMTNAVLDSLFNQHYNFSAYKIINPEDVESVKLLNKPLFFALVGSHYAALDEPPTEGIYLMDSDYELTEFPFPTHTGYPRNINFIGGSRPCFHSIPSSRTTIMSFNKRLHVRS